LEHNTLKESTLSAKEKIKAGNLDLCFSERLAMKHLFEKFCTKEDDKRFMLYIEEKESSGE